MTDMRQMPPAPAPGSGAPPVSGLFRERYPELVRLADLLGADDPEDIVQEAFAQLIRKQRSLRDPPGRSRRSPSD
jgi:DNA-directed RNA polymerase specialized sigma24 family protein